MKIQGHIKLAREEELHLRTPDGHTVFLHVTKAGDIAVSDERWEPGVGYYSLPGTQVVLLTQQGWGLSHHEGDGYDLLAPMVHRHATLRAAAEAVVRHWDEFGTEHGLDEVIECLRNTLIQGD